MPQADPPPAGRPEPGTGRDAGGFVVLVVSASAFLVPFMGSALNLAVPAIGRELAAPVVALNWAVGAYLLSSAALLLPLGRLADLAGRRRVFVAGLVLHAVATLACGVAGSIGALIALRALQGAAAAMGFATGMAIVTATTPRGRRGHVLGLTTAAVYAGLSLGPVLGGLLTERLGWRSIFFVTGAAGAALALGAAVGLRGEWFGPVGERLDGAGAALYSASVVLLLVGLSTSGSASFGVWMLAVGAAGLVAFVAAQTRARDPLLRLSLFADAAFAFSNFAALLHYAATFAVGFLLSLYLQSVRGLDVRTAGLVLLAQPVLMALLSPLAGRLSDRVEPRLVASAGMLLTCSSLALFALLEPTTPLAVVLAGLALLGTGFGLFSSPNSNAVMSAVDPHHLGIASATLGTMRCLGQAGSLALVGLLLALSVGRTSMAGADTAQLLGGIRTSFAVMTLLCLAGVPASLARGRIHGVGVSDLPPVPPAGS
jgi:EmrB/QacA subfamily drug resistance transporter